VKKLLPAVVIACLLLTGCAGTPRMSVSESCTFLQGDTFKPTGNQQQQADQIAKHYQEVADKVAPELADPIQKMADVMKQVAGTSLGAKSPEQLEELKKQNNKIGDVCK
jgi:outer membrane murein-binding lipoprotein Lpp